MFQFNLNNKIMERYFFIVTVYTHEQPEIITRFVLPLTLILKLTILSNCNYSSSGNLC